MGRRVHTREYPTVLGDWVSEGARIWPTILRQRSRCRASLPNLGSWFPGQPADMVI